LEEQHKGTSELFYQT